jgi:hypothetical protein
MLVVVHLIYSIDELKSQLIPSGAPFSGEGEGKSDDFIF